jgi:hypothetical protein
MHGFHRQELRPGGTNEPVNRDRVEQFAAVVAAAKRRNVEVWIAHGGRITAVFRPPYVEIELVSDVLIDGVPLRTGAKKPPPKRGRVDPV